MDQLVATVKSLQVELTDMEEKHKAKSKQASDLQAMLEELKRELEMQLNKLQGAQASISSLTKQMEEARRAAEASEETTEQLGKEVERLLGKEVERLRGEIAGVEDMKRQQAQGFETQRIEPCALFSSVSISSLTKQVDRLRRGKEEAEIAVDEVHQKPENAQASADERYDGVQQLHKVLKQEIEGRQSLAEQVAELERILTRTKEQLEDHRHSHAKSLADKEAEMATMRMQLAEAGQRHSGMFDLVVKAHRLLNGECSVCD
jgi:chromosome segregation ATPase